MSSAPPDTLVLRDATVADAEAFAAFAERVFRETYKSSCRAEDIDVYVADNFGPELQRAQLGDPDVRTILATVGGEIVGYVQLRPDAPPDCVTEAPAIEIGRFYVDHAWHGAGMAQTIMRAALDAVPAGTRVVWLGVFQHNQRAVRFYTRMGFRIAGAQPFVMGSDSQDDWIMVRDVDA